MYENDLTDLGEKIGTVEEEIGTYSTVRGSNALNLKEYEDKTIEDYLNLPADVRVELIDGVFYDMAAPTSTHQIIAQEVFSELRNHILSKKGSCIPVMSPIDVQLDGDNRTMVQPDVIIVCDKNKITKLRVVGAPDFIVEVLSPSNWYQDTIRKLRKYRKAGVREYWIVMPDSRKILSYLFEKSPDPDEYSFDDEVPVRIWDEAFKVNFIEIEKRLESVFS